MKQDLNGGSTEISVWMEVMWARWGCDTSLGTWIGEICDLSGAEWLYGPGWR